jgi:O-antigen/teichoic acid export membrane protein
MIRTALRDVITARRRILGVGIPVLVSRVTVALWGILVILIIRVLPEEMYAVYAVARSLEMFGVLFGGGFIQSALLKLVAEGDTKRENRFANAGIVVSLVLSVVTGMLLIAGEGLVGSFYSSLDFSGLMIYLAGIVLSGTVAGLPRIIMLSRRRTTAVMLSDLLQFAVRAGIVGAMILNGTLRTPQQIFLATIIANIAAFFLSLFLARGHLAFSAGLTRGSVSEVMRFAVVMLGTSLANIIYSRTDILMLGKMAPLDVAAYGACRSLSTPVIHVNAAANMILLPLLSQMWRQGKRSMVRSRTWGGILLAEAMVFPVALVLVLFPGQILDFVFAGKYTSGWPILQVFGALTVIRPFGSIFSTMATAAGKPQYSLYCILWSATLNVGLNFLLIPSMGGMGAAIATCVAVIAGAAWVTTISTRFVARAVDGAVRAGPEELP